MTAAATVLGLLAFAAFLWAVVLYNRLVGARNRVLAAWSDIDVQLKRRHDLVPKLVDAVKQYAAYERSLLEEVTELRTRGIDAHGVRETGRIEGRMSERVRAVLALAEAYPALEANKSFLALQKELTDVENNIQYARRYYNGAVRMLNTRVDSFPDLLVARTLGFRHAEYFELDDAGDRRSPELGL
ncbi:MAG: LemA family protein [Gammaproteobacteria bacterium]|nr:LemA family protein [Gammaproteobacteria bacterium]